MRFGIYTLPAGSRWHAKPVTLSEPKSVAALAVAQRTLSQACKPFADRIAAMVAKNADADTSPVIAKQEESPAVIAARADVARLSKLVAEDIAKQRPVVFVPLAHDGTPSEWDRVTVDAATRAEWEAETDGEKRTAILARGKLSTGHKSVVGINRSQQVLMATIYPGRDDLRAALASGTLIIPQDRADKAATTKRVKRSVDEQTDAALDLLFPAADAVADEPTNPEPTVAG